MARRLKTVCDLRRYVASLINRVEAKKLDPMTAGRLCYMANTLKGIIEISDFEERLSQLEERLKEK